ncbi:MAG: hypothetical protein NW241_21525 [Bacteroidia bacterium]|nr:hypothetical protein [Bacteroidia bacterium]
MPDKYHHTIDQLLREIPELERCLERAQDARTRHALRRTLTTRLKRLDHLIPFQFRLELHRLCESSGVRGQFL